MVDLDDPLAPRITATIGAPQLNDPRGVVVQFRYAFVVDRDGLKVLDMTALAQPKPIPSALIPLEDARNIYVARTYAYVSAGKRGLAIIDVEKPDAPKLDQLFFPALVRVRLPNSSQQLARGALPSPFRRALTATGPSTSPATNLPSSVAAAPARSIAGKCADCTSTRLLACLTRD